MGDNWKFSDGSYLSDAGVPAPKEIAGEVERVEAVVPEPHRYIVRYHNHHSKSWCNWSSAGNHDEALMHAEELRGRGFLSDIEIIDTRPSPTPKPEGAVPVEAIGAAIRACREVRYDVAAQALADFLSSLPAPSKEASGPSEEVREAWEVIDACVTEEIEDARMNGNLGIADGYQSSLAIIGKALGVEGGR